MFNLSESIAALADKIDRGGRLSRSEAKTFLSEAPLALLGLLATHAKERKSGKAVFYNRNFHIEPTNVCVFNCRFCSYRRPAGSPEAWDYTMEEVEQIARGRQGKGITEVHIVGGVHPDHGLEYYIDMIRRVKAILPEAAVKAFTAIELSYMIRKAGLSVEEGLRQLKEAGMAAIPGGGAEIFDQEIRSRICPDKGSTDEWLEVHETAHRLAPSRELAGKIHRMTEFCRHSPQWDHVPDPYYEGHEGFELVLDLLEDACEGLLDDLKNPTRS